MRALVTGATGFIGGHLAQGLVARGHRVRVLVRSLAALSTQSRFEIARGDITDPAAVASSVADVDVVFHLAAIRDRWGIAYHDYYRVNVEGTRNLLAAAAENRCRFVYCSSVGVMGHPGCLEIDEGFPYAPADGKYSYSHTKALADQMVLNYATRGRLSATVIRPTIVYGPGDTYGMVTQLIDLLARGRFLQLGSGKNHLHLTYISDVVEGFLLAGECERSGGQALILAGPAPITLDALVSKVCGALGARPPRWHVPAGTARAAGHCMEVLFTLKRKAGVTALGTTPFITRDKVDTLVVNRGYSSARAQDVLGYRPAVDYDAGLRLTADWWRSWRRL